GRRRSRIASTVRRSSCARTTSSPAGATSADAPRARAVRPLLLPARPWIVAHRGVSAELLENTIPSVVSAVEQAAPMAEVDVQLASDGTLVVFHDWDLQRLGGGDLRVVERTPAPELATVALALARQRTADAAQRAVLAGALPTLAGLLAAVSPSFPLNLELKRREA